MLTIKRHFLINKLSMSRALYKTKESFGRLGSAIAAGVASLRDRSQSMGKKSILSSLVLLVGFFGTLSALLMLYPLTTDRGSTQPASPTNANIETEQQASADAATKGAPADTGSAARTPFADTSAPSIVTSPTAPAPTAPEVISAPATQSSPAPAVPGPMASQPMITTQPTITTTPSVPAPAPADAAPTSPAPSASDPTSLLPMVTAPVTEPVQDATKAVQGTADGLLD